MWPNFCFSSNLSYITTLESYRQTITTLPKVVIYCRKVLLTTLATAEYVQKIFLIYGLANIHRSWANVWAWVPSSSSALITILLRLLSIASRSLGKFPVVLKALLPLTGACPYSSDYLCLCKSLPTYHFSLCL